MNIHKNARLTPLGRAELARRVLEGGEPVAIVARDFHVCSKTVRKWVERRQKAGSAMLCDRSSRPHRLRKPTSQAKIDDIVTLRRQRFTGKHIARAAGVSAATVSRVLKRAGLSRLRDLEPVEPVKRYERQNPGDMIHIDIKKLGRFERVGHRITGDRTGQSRSRGVGWEFVHVCVDDASRVAFTQIKPDEKAVSAIDFLKAAVAYYKSLGVTPARVMTDNGSCYVSRAFAKACKRLRLKHIRTKALHAEDQRQGRALYPDRLARMGVRNRFRVIGPTRRGASGLDAQIQLASPAWRHKMTDPPISRLGLTGDNLLRLHT